MSKTLSELLTLPLVDKIIRLGGRQSGLEVKVKLRVPLIINYHSVLSGVRPTRRFRTRTKDDVQIFAFPLQWQDTKQIAKLTYKPPCFHKQTALDVANSVSNLSSHPTLPSHLSTGHRLCDCQRLMRHEWGKCWHSKVEGEDAVRTW